MDHAPTPDQLGDHALLAAYAAGDQVAFELLVTRHHGLVTAACRRQLRGADVDDAAQAVFLVLARRPLAAAVCPSIEAWLVRTAWQICATAVRARQRRRRAEQESAVQRPPCDSNSDLMSADAEVLPLLDRCLDALPERERLAIAMHYLAGRSHDEVALALACPKGTVYSHLSRGLARLRAQLARRGAAVATTALIATLARQAEAATMPGPSLITPSTTAHHWADLYRTRHFMTHTCLPATAALLLGGVATALLLPHAQAPAAEVAPVPGTTPVTVSSTPPLTALPADTRIVVRLHDHARASNRWTDSPYGTLLATTWGQQLDQKSQENPGVFKLLNDLQATQTALFGITVADQEPVGHLIGTLPAGGTLQIPGAIIAGTAPAVTATLPLQPYQLDQALRQRGPGFNGGMRFRWDALLPVPAASLTAATSVDADAEATWFATMPEPTPPVLITAAWTCTPYGMREQLHLREMPAVPAGAPAATLDRSALAGLPPTALWAVATAALPALAERLPGFATDPFDTWAAESGLPAWSTLRGSLGGALLWAEEGAPFPGMSLAVQMPEDLGKTMLGMLDAKARFVPSDDGVHVGAMGFIPAQAAWRDGWLYLTTASGGITAASSRQGGFLGVPEIASAERELQNGPKPVGELLALGFSRSATSWNSVASLAGWLTRRTPALATLAPDLKAAGKFGFFALRRTPDAALVDAGGLLGGPLSTSQIIGAFFRTFMSGGRPPGGQRPPEPAPAAAEPPAKVEF